MSSSHLSISAPVVIIIVSVVLLLNSHVGSCSCYKRIFGFGDGTMDTGNFVHMLGKAPSRLKELPYGKTFFKNATGRMSDGRVLIDFYAEALQLPLIPPILPEKDYGQFPYGANFAVMGATVLEAPLYPGSSLFSLGVQTDWFDEMVYLRATGDDARKHFLRDSDLILMGEIGSNDYFAYFSAGNKPHGNAADEYITNVMTYIMHFVEELILDRGAKVFVIPNNFPVGCWASYLSRFHSDNPEDYDEHKCLRWLNNFTQKHNERLRWEVNRLRNFYPHVKLIYADYYGATMDFIKNPSKFGIDDPVVACCGGDGPYHTSMECNSTAKIWGDPGRFANWDGMHMTEKAYNIIVQGVINGPFADPPFPQSC
ncbi:hypothetical protein BDA96_05G027600 [Sorghum bicolor]|uniref:GDSL esterase/lipase n=1 Tax=Sorghum bicolor TaxID=4558 RepID=A0A921UED4_SORBI|nr:hypothetical protein BDA96_05G027600 [Sorghum bicolor]